MTVTSHWRTLTLGEATVVNPRRSGSSIALGTADNVSFVPMASVDEHTGTIATPEVRAFGDVKSGFTWFRDGDVIFAKITPCMQNGKAAVARGLVGGVGFGSTEFHVLRPGPQVLPEWIWYFVREQTFRDEARRNFKGTAGQQRVPADWLGSQLVPVPPLAEQRRILACLREAMAKVHEVRRLREEALAESRGLLPSLLKDVFADVAGVHPSATVGSLTTETRYGTSEKCSPANTGSPVLRIPNVAAGCVNFDNLKFLPSKVRPTDPLALRDGDLLVVRTNGSPDLVGRCAVVPALDGTFAYASYLIRVRLDPRRADSRYLSYFLASTLGRDQIATKRHTSAGQYNINTQDIHSIEVPLPPLAAQRELVRRMVEVEAAAKATQLELAEALIRGEALPSSILRKAFAGEL